MIALSLLIALVLYVLLAWIAVRMIGRLARFCAVTTVTTKVLQVLCTAFFVLLPTWDIIPGRLYFKNLCDNQAEIKILKTVDLEEKYFLSNGQADGEKVGNQFRSLFNSDKQFSSLFNIEKRESALQDSGTGETLGTTREFVYRGGWLTRLILPDTTYLCRQYEYSSAHMVLWREVIRLKKI